MKRRVVTILVLLLLSAIVNVMVAWCATALTTWPGRFLTLERDRREVAWPRPVPDHWPEPADLIRYGAFAWTLDRYVATTFEDRADGARWPVEHFTIEVVSVGWPTRTLQWDRWVDCVPPAASETAKAIYTSDDQPKPTWWYGGIALPSTRFGFGPQSEKRLPLRPLWPTFAVNTVCYAISLWLIIGSLSLFHRLMRITRGHCPGCGYDLRGSLAAGCPECGWRR